MRVIFPCQNIWNRKQQAGAGGKDQLGRCIHALVVMRWRTNLAWELNLSFLYLSFYRTVKRHYSYQLNNDTMEHELIRGPSRGTMYITSLYFTMTCMTSVGFGVSRPLPTISDPIIRCQSLFPWRNPSAQLLDTYLLLYPPVSCLQNVAAESDNEKLFTVCMMVSSYFTKEANTFFLLFFLPH
jgi:hypothetical protein